MTLFNRKGRVRRRRFEEELTQLLIEADERDRSYWSDVLLYVEVGRDRYKLPEDYVENARAWMVERKTRP
jgi:hypothetical protein